MCPPLSNQESSDIKVLSANAHGKDYVVGDIHGNIDEFIKALKELKENDRLFSLGDLTDRGKDSPGVIKEIIEVNKKSPGKIQVIRGNHENMVLATIRAYEELAVRFADKSKVGAYQWSKFTDWMVGVSEEYKKMETNYFDDATKRIVSMHFINGGMWLAELFVNELVMGRITINAENKIEYSSDSQVKMINDFMQQLPYIIHVKGGAASLPFNTVHADMAIDDQRLDNLIASIDETSAAPKTKLTDQEKEDITWLRKLDIATNKNKYRTVASVLTFVGHNILYRNMELPEHHHSTNTIGLDVGCYDSKTILVYNATDHTYSYLGSGVKEFKSDLSFDQIDSALKQRTQEQQALNSMCEKLKKCVSAEEARAILTDTEKYVKCYKPFKHIYNQLLQYAINNKAVKSEWHNELLAASIVYKPTAASLAKFKTAMNDYLDSLPNSNELPLSYAKRHAFIGNIVDLIENLSAVKSDTYGRNAGPITADDFKMFLNMSNIHRHAQLHELVLDVFTAFEKTRNASDVDKSLKEKFSNMLVAGGEQEKKVRSILAADYLGMLANEAAPAVQRDRLFSPKLSDEIAKTTSSPTSPDTPKQ